MKPSKDTYQIRLTGIVQGVGFRPFVYNLAAKFALKGFVSNGLDGINIVFNANNEEAAVFYKELTESAPAQALILKKEIKKIPAQFFDKFEIHESKSTGKPDLVLTPDYAVCNACLDELKTPGNRRFGYPFITCSQCGPRYSIITKLPYDRESTTMAAFEMCNECKAEYQNREDTRFFAQTSSCPNCGITISVFDNARHLVSDSRHEVIALIVSYLNGGKILAIKGIGGYLLMCDATSQAVVELLRKRKYRPSKPFAVMFQDIESIKKNAELSAKEQNALISDVSPIVLLKQKPDSVICQSVNPNLDRLGVVLPYTPLLHLICQAFGKPLVATSGNIAGNPIIYDDELALRDFSEIADYIITNNRKIVMPQDDSVVHFTQKHQQRIILRRSRGFSLVIGSESAELPASGLSLGASIKNTFALQTDTYSYVSQYLGDLESYETQQNAERVLNSYLELFKDAYMLTHINCDIHDGYFSTELAHRLSQQWAIPVRKIQHHEAHLSAVLNENPEINLENPVLGVIWDGTGYGTDGNSWGGEFFVWEKKQLQNRHHFEYFDTILADKMPREPRISALCLTYGVSGSEVLMQNKFTTAQWNLYQKIIKKNTLKTSSVGRVFDGVASLLGLLDIQSYEGEAAVLLEQAAQSYFENHGYDFYENYFSDTVDTEQIPVKPFIEQLLKDVNSGKPKEWIAAKFHFSMVSIIYAVAGKMKSKQIALSGGVFQNALLVDLLIDNKPEDYSLFFHKNLPPNDENISFGQMYHSQTFK